MSKILYKGLIYEESNPIVGGVGDNTNPSNTDELKKGIKVEKEHTGDSKIAEDIAKDHLAEFPIKEKGKGYYSELEKMEDKLKTLVKKESKR